MAQVSPRNASVEESIVLAFFDLSNQLAKLGEALAARAGLTTQQWLVLLQVAGDPNFHSSDGRTPLPAFGVTASEIAQARGVSRANVSILVTQLLGKGLIRWRPEAGDRRRRRLFVTARGRAALTRLDASRRRANRALLARLDTAERFTLLHALRACLDQVWQALATGHAPREAPHEETRSRAGTTAGG